MVKFLLQRPIAVLMAFTACFLLGLVTYFTIPVSLLPDIAIPEITVQVSGPNTSARELENTVVKTIRQQLMQVTRLKEIQSETYDGAGIVRLYFDFGTDTNLAFIEVNEKIDAAMNYLPKTFERPRVVKASATDIPIFYLNLTLKDDNRQDINSFIELCDFAGSVIKRRIEQLPEVAMADITGIVKRQIQIVPDMDLLEITEISLAELEQALTDNNIEPGSMKVRDGYYEYNIKFSSFLRTVEDVKDIYLRKHNRIYQLKQLAQVEEVPEQESGLSIFNGKRAVTLAVIKQADENMDNMKASLQEVMEHFIQVYPDIDFNISRSQTELLDYTISNLKQNFLLAFLLIFITALLFMGDIKSPLVIGISMIVSLVISILFFYLFHVSLNIISLSGLILAMGMMIDNSIIVTENIAQYRLRDFSLEEACDKGTTEVITPMLSSAFTTIAVFVPLVFMSGIAGAIFFDQAFAVTVGLLVSYFTGIMLLPVLYKLIYSLPTAKRKGIHLTFKNPINPQISDHFYHIGVDYIFRHKTGAIAFILISVPLCAFLFYQIPKSRMPEVKEFELMTHIEWNENIHVEENQRRVNQLFSEISGKVLQYTAYIGQQQYLLKREQELSVSEAELYFKAGSPEEIAPLQESISQWLKKGYPQAIVSFTPPETIFEKLFVTGEADVIAELYPYNRNTIPESHTIKEMENLLTQTTGYIPVSIAFDKQLNIHIDQEKLLLYQVDYNEVYRILKTAFKENEVTTLRSFQQYLPIVLAGNEQPVNSIIHSILVPTLPNEKGDIRQIPLSALLRITQGEDLKSITAGKNGEYIPFRFYEVKNEEKLIEEVKAGAGTGWEVSFSGSFLSNKQMINELVIILFIAILLMYFILAAQFESFLQPMIVILEIPIDVAAALLILWICGHTLNLMSAIGIVVTCGIIINDSILKLDAINELRKAGLPLMKAIHEAGQRRLRPILMTSITTIFAMVPLLFTSDLGSELQKPLAIAIIAAMVIGTTVSLFIIPLIYWFIYRKEEQI